MGSLLRDIKGAVFAHEALAIWLFFSFLLTLTGPFSTFETMSLGLRAVYWPGLMALTIVLGQSLLHLSHRVLPHWPLIWSEALRVLLFTVIFTPTLRWITLSLVPDEPMRDKPVLMLFALVGAIAVSVSLIRQAYAAMRRSALAASGPIPVPDQNRFRRRLPPSAQAEILRLSVADHYVLAHLADGSVHRVLMRFADAVDELDGALGLCVHRSHWVACSSIARVARHRGRDVVVMKTGDEIPIGPKYRPDLIAAGWMAEPDLSKRNRKTAPSREDGEGLAAE